MKPLKSTTLVQLREELAGMSTTEINNLVTDGGILTINSHAIRLSAVLTSEQLTLSLQQGSSIDITLSAMAEFANSTLSSYLPSVIDIFTGNLPLTQIDIIYNLSQKSVYFSYNSTINNDWEMINNILTLEQTAVNLSSNYKYISDNLLGSFSGNVSGNIIIDGSDYQAIIYFRGPHAWELEIIPKDSNLLPNLASIATVIGGNTLKDTVQNGLNALKIDEIAIDGVQIGFELQRRTLRYVSMRSHIELAGARINVFTRLPQFQFGGTLAKDSKISLKGIIQYYFQAASAFPEINITELSFTAYPSAGLYTFDIYIETEWELKLSTTQFTFAGTNLFLEKTTEDIFGSITAYFCIQDKVFDDVKISIMAQCQGQNAGWIFEGKQTDGVVKLGELAKKFLPNTWQIDGYGINGLGIRIETKTNSYQFTGKTAKPWSIDPLNLTISANVMLGYNGGSQTLGVPMFRISKAEMPVLIADSSTELMLASTSGNNKKSNYYGEISAEIKWNNIEIIVFYNFDPEYNSFGIIWGFLTGKIEEKEIQDKQDKLTKHNIATLTFTQSTTLGSIIEIMVSWATGSKFSLSAPWNVLDKIPLNNFDLIWDFTTETVEFRVNIGPINLGFVTINSIGLSYEKDPDEPEIERKSVMVDLDAKFIWGEPIPKWDATKPETTPAPPGSGNKYLDLRLLAMGQHITFT